MRKNDGGPAFPLPVNDFQDAMNHPRQGMSLRDWFAGMALSGILAEGEHSKMLSLGMEAQAHKSTARWAYNYADDMLAEREKS